MRNLTLDDLGDLLIGCAVLGSGGGGDPFLDYMITRHEFEQQISPSLISIAELQPDDLIFPIGHTGAPLARLEKISSGREIFKLFDLVEKRMGKKPNVVMPFEIGGGNSFIPLVAAAQLRLPILDADLMGRAFPVSEMTSWHLSGAIPISAFIANSLGNNVTIDAKDTYRLEKIGRQVTVAMGSSAYYGFYPIPGSQAEKCTIPKSISKAIAIGKIHQQAQKNGKDPVSAILRFCQGTYISSGKIVDIDRIISGGFLNGKIMIQSSQVVLELFFQNEYLLAKRDNEVIASTPDLLVLFEQETGMPIASESLQYGLNVHLAVLPAPEIWTTSAGLSVTGPRYFGYDVDYKPINSENILV